MAFPNDLAIGQWWQAPSSGNYRLNDVAVSPSPGGVIGVAAEMADWGGAVFDSKRRDLVIFNGGHNDYYGNEVYAFNVDTFLWRRKTTASVATTGTAVDSNADGTPASRHGYGSLVYLANQDKLFAGDGGYVQGTTGAFTAENWVFDMSTETPNSTGAGAWTQQDIAPTISPASGPDVLEPKVYNPVDNLIYSQENRGLASFDITAAAGSQWTPLTNFEGPGGGTAATSVCAIVGGTPYMLRVGGGHTYIRSLVSPFSYVDSEAGATTSGSTVIEGITGPGILFDPISGKVFGWSGTLTGGTDNRDYYMLDVAAKKWTRLAGTGDTPDGAQTNGTWGRFCYIGDGLAVLVNTVTSNVFYLRVSKYPKLPSRSPIRPRAFAPGIAR